MPRKLREEIRICLSSKSHGLTSMNDLAATALTAYLKILRRAEVDAGFAQMANDEAFKRETARIMKEFEYADAEAFRLMAKKGQI